MKLIPKNPVLENPAVVDPAVPTTFIEFGRADDNGVEASTVKTLLTATNAVVVAGLPWKARFWMSSA